MQDGEGEQGGQGGGEAECHPVNWESVLFVRRAHGLTAKTELYFQ